jgi:hypothetical protein
MSERCKWYGIDSQESKIKPRVSDCAPPGIKSMVAAWLREGIYWAEIKTGNNRGGIVACFDFRLLARSGKYGSEQAFRMASVNLLI